MQANSAMAKALAALQKLTSGLETGTKLGVSIYWQPTSKYSLDLFFKTKAQLTFRRFFLIDFTSSPSAIWHVKQVAVSFTLTLASGMVRLYKKIKGDPLIWKRLFVCTGKGHD